MNERPESDKKKEDARDEKQRQVPVVDRQKEDKKPLTTRLKERLKEMQEQDSNIYPLF